MSRFAANADDEEEYYMYVDKNDGNDNVYNGE